MIKRLRAVTVFQWLLTFFVWTFLLFVALYIFGRRVPNEITPTLILVMVGFDILLTVLACLSYGSNKFENEHFQAEIQNKIQMAQARRLEQTPTVASFKALFPIEFDVLDVDHPDFFNPYCKDCGGLIRIHMWESNKFDEKTGKPISEVLVATCPRHPKVRREITRPVDRA